uniref:uncharacterized protein LOC122592853 n=1 Tax=Erigeron canadensis TaxID=72917 RepID=UPI001CB9212D|nr:uncharacterized protein LOC122592853 [Erigeron canadensis]
MAADSIEELELEAMKIDDCSWHPCQVYFSPNGVSLVIEFENNGFQDILVSEKEALTRIRVRSLPLQDDDCTRVKPGEHVVVKQNSESETGSFDAEVEKVVRVRHSKRADCRCSFMIKWLHQDLNGGSLTVPSSLLLRLANKSITKHPTISAFIDAVSAELNVVNDFDLDLHDLLEKQIEGIRNSVDDSKKRISDEIFGLEDEQEIQMDNSTPNGREPETGIPIVSPLNPFAARAALASLMSKFPESVEISMETEDLSKSTKLSLETEAASKAVKKSRKSLFSITSSSEVLKISSTVLVNKRGKGDIKANKTITRLTRAKVQKVGGLSDDNSERSTLVEDKKPSSVTSRRLTRSVLDKEGEKLATEPTTEVTKTSSNARRLTRSLLDKEVETLEPTTEVTKPTSNMRRLTRSVLEKERDNLATDPTTEVTKTSSNGRRLTRSISGKDGDNSATEPTTEGTNSSTNGRRLTRSVLGKDRDNSATEPTTEGTNSLSNARRLTRSVLDKEGDNLATDPTTEDMKASINVGRLRRSVLNKDEQHLPDGPTTEDTKISSNIRRITRSVIHQEAAITNTEAAAKALGAEELPTGQRNKKRNADGDVTSNAGSSLGSKKKSLDLNKQLRSSPRFNPKF